MEPRKKKQQHNDWYRVSVESLRAWTAVLVVAVAAGLGFFAYRAWQHGFEKEAARSTLEAAEDLANELRNKPGIQSFVDDLATARKARLEARELYDHGDFHHALGSARSSRDLLQWILDNLEHRGPVGEARFISVEGEVHVRRGETGDWEPAQREMTLNAGDYIRTAGHASAEVMFANGTFSTVRQDTMILIPRPRANAAGGSTQAITMKYGWVNLNTSERESSVETPEAAAVVESNTEATVTYDQGRGEARFVAYEGEMRVAAKNGTERIVRPLEQVVQQQDKLGNPNGVPPRVELMAPTDKVQINLDTTSRLELAWQPSPRAARYALQVSRSHHFVDNVIEATDRTKTTAAIGLRGEGSFDWRVAAIDRNGAQGPWSEPRSFRVASITGSTEKDTVPPRLEIKYVRPYGSLFILVGATDPGAEVMVNGEPVTVASDGTFTKTIQITVEGWSILTITARDLAGNVTERHSRVFVEPF